MLKFSRLPMGLLALTIAAPVMAQPAMTTTPSSNVPSVAPVTPKAATPDTRSSAAAPKAEMVDINTATTAELKMLPGVSDNDASKIVHGRPYTDKGQLVSKKVVSEPTYQKIKDHVVARQAKS